MITTALIMLPELKNAPENWPLQKVAGLSLIERNLMAVKAQGATRVFVFCPKSMGPAVEEHLQQLKDDRRLPHWSVHADEENKPEGLSGPLLRIHGTRLFHNNWLKEALACEQMGALQHDGKSIGLDLLSEPGSPAEPGAELKNKGFAMEAALPEQQKAAAKKIWRSLIKTSDGWFSVHLNRPVSLSLSKIVSIGPIHPNWVTLFTLMVGLASAVFSAFGTWMWIAIGGVLYQLASILDGVDGEIARVKFLGTKSGQWMDTISDDTTNFVYIAGVTIGVWRATGWHWILWVGGAAMVLDLLVVGLMYHQLIVRFKTGTLLGFEWDFQKDDEKKGLGALVAKLEPFLKRDLYGLLFMVLAIAGIVWLVPILSALGLIGALVTFLGQMAKWRAEDRRLKIAGEKTS
ncbi:MAG: CDP-alcohol phosphatidyltransferase family protein [Deltaproteobacteria bacterium]|nr:CDP-alcohol phosphatidyltransferase family protein [Deltaproteobacteria bacterium]